MIANSCKWLQMIGNDQKCSQIVTNGWKRAQMLQMATSGLKASKCSKFPKVPKAPNVLSVPNVSNVPYVPNVSNGHRLSSYSNDLHQYMRLRKFMIF